MEQEQSPQEQQDQVAPNTIPVKKRYTPEQQRQKRRLVRRTILVCLGLIPLFIWLQSLIFKYESSLPFSSNVLIFSLININVLLVLLVLFLVLRNLAELLFERRLNVLGSKLKTKLVVSFLSLSLIPTILLFFVALQFVSTSMEYWFNSSIENSLQESLKLAQQILQDNKNKANQMSKGIADKLGELQIKTYDAEAINSTLENILEFNKINGPDSITLVTSDNNLEIVVFGPKLKNLALPTIPADTLQKVEKFQSREIVVQETTRGDLIRSVAFVQVGSNPKNMGTLITSVLMEQEQMNRMTLISQGIEGYRQLKYFKGPFKFWLVIILVIVTLLIVFAAIWFGLHISRGITEPIDKLVSATQRVAGGDLEFEMERTSDDEMGLLVESFNEMTNNLNSSNKQLADTHLALEESSQESEQRRKYMEIILQNVSAGVISVDFDGKITTINRFAEKLLNIDRSIFLNHRYQDTLPREHSTVIDNIVTELQLSGKNSVQQHLKINVLQKNYSLLVNFTRLTDDDNNPIGFVLVFDDLTKIEKMQRMAAWREVARRIAHEIKNPLTPIQLSAQRLRRRYPDIIAEEDSVFDRCTNTIISQVDEIKNLVSEFSQFARMPKVNKSHGDLGKLCNDTLVLYKEAHKEIQFNCVEKTPLPKFYFDSEQIKRCVINLLDNAVAALPDGGQIDIDISTDAENESAFLAIKDNGPGISKENKSKLFEPYFSTKKSGTGLGLAIVSTIVSDHSGYIRIQDNQPKGSVFTIELPLITNSIS